MDGRTSVRYLQDYIRQKDHHPERLTVYFLKLAEEVGELSRAMQEGRTAADAGEIKGTIDEELWDVMYYTLALANLYGVDMERAIAAKEALNQRRYPAAVAFEADR